jgi:hypothetical protein
VGVELGVSDRSLEMQSIMNRWCRTIFVKQGEVETSTCQVCLKLFVWTSNFIV